MRTLAASILLGLSACTFPDLQPEDYFACIRSAAGRPTTEGVKLLAQLCGEKFKAKQPTPDNPDDYPPGQPKNLWYTTQKEECVTLSTYCGTGEWQKSGGKWFYTCPDSQYLNMAMLRVNGRNNVSLTNEKAVEPVSLSILSATAIPLNPEEPRFYMPVYLSLTDCLLAKRDQHYSALVQAPIAKEPSDDELARAVAKDKIGSSADPK